MNSLFQPCCLPALIGSMPLTNHVKAADLAFEYTPDIPVWVQLPHFSQEGMVAQFIPGLPGIEQAEGRTFIDAASENFDSDFLEFFEEYMDVTEGRAPLETSRFALSTESANGFFELESRVAGANNLPQALKGQITGPFSFCTSLTDKDKRAIFYNDSLRDAAVKHLSLKAVWQVRRLSRFNRPVIIFIDEPALAGFGSSEFISITKEGVAACLDEVIAAIHAEGGLAGIHVCANTDWSLVLGSQVDIANFDAYGYFDRFLLYPDAIKAFLNRGGILAWGIVPTLKKEEITAASADSLTSRLQEYVGQLEKLGLERKTIFSQSLITPSCGVGSLSLDLAVRVMELTRDVSRNMRNEMGL